MMIFVNFFSVFFGYIVSFGLFGEYKINNFDCGVIVF